MSFAMIPPSEEEEVTPGQKALNVMKSLAGVLGGAAYAAGVSGAAQNPWAGPHALAQLRAQGVENEMRKMQMAAYAEKARRQQQIISHMQENFSDVSDPAQRQAAIQYLMSQGAYEFAEKASGIFSNMFGSPAEDQAYQRQVELEKTKSGLRKDEAAYDAELEQKLAAGLPPDYKDVSKMQADYGKRGGDMLRDIADAAGRIEAAYQTYLHGTDSEKGVAFQVMNTALNKLIDPGSVVRESEFARLRTYLGYKDKMYSWWEMVKSGAVSPSVMSAIAKMGRQLLREAASQQVDPYGQFQQMSLKYFRDDGPHEVLGGYNDPMELIQKLNRLDAEQRIDDLEDPAAEPPPPGTTIPSAAGPLSGYAPPEGEFTITEMP